MKPPFKEDKTTQVAAHSPFDNLKEVVIVNITSGTLWVQMFTNSPEYIRKESR